jgi:hypothetical protein
VILVVEVVKREKELEPGRGRTEDGMQLRRESRVFHSIFTASHLPPPALIANSIAFYTRLFVFLLSITALSATSTH